ncbi:MAG: ATP-binding protein [Elusimicrobiota bacterium]
MADARIQCLIETVERMRRRDFRIEVPEGTEDEIGRLCASLGGLAESLKGRPPELERLAALIERVGSGLRLDDVLDHIYKSFRDIIPYDRIGCALLEKKGAILRSRWMRNDSGEIKLIKNYWAPMRNSSLLKIIATGRPRIINDLQQYLHEHPASQSTQMIVAEGIRSSLTCPLIAAGKPRGFLFFSSRTPGTYRKVHADVYLGIASRLSMAIEKGRLYQELLELGELKNKFLGMASHDLRHPLTIIMGLAALLQDDDPLPGPESTKSLAGKIITSADSMLALLDNLLDLSVLESGRFRIQPRRVVLEEFFQGCLVKYRPLAEAKEISLIFESAGMDYDAVLDPVRIEQVLVNLISNAVKFSNSGTRIAIRVSCWDETLRVSVEDEGQGIPKEELQGVFDPDTQLSVKPTGSERSTGVGLLIVRQIVEAHGGNIRVGSVEGRGSNFIFELPLKGPPKTGRSAPAEKVREKTSG